MKPGDLVRVRPAAWTVRIVQSLDDPSSGGEKLTADDVLLVVDHPTEVIHYGVDGELKPLIKVMTPRGTVGYVSVRRLELIC